MLLHCNCNFIQVPAIILNGIIVHAALLVSGSLIYILMENITNRANKSGEPTDAPGILKNIYLSRALMLHAQEIHTSILKILTLRLYT